MTIKFQKLTINNFRNYDYLKLDNLDSSNIVITGENGAGKTNILEALSFFSQGTGLRNSKLSEILNIKKSDDIWALNTEIDKNNEKIKISTGFQNQEETEKRILKIDGEKIKSQTELNEILSIVWIIPSFDKLFLEESKKRRRFLDKLICDFDPYHTKRLSRYQTSLSERSRLIKRGKNYDSWLNAVEENIVNDGIAISAARCDFISKLNTVIKSRKTNFPKIKIEPIGLIEETLSEKKAYETEDIFRDILKNSRKTTINGMLETFEGSHKFDWQAFHIEKGMPAFKSSTGEQKIILIGIILAYSELMKLTKGYSPILLLDEITAHLDDIKKQHLFEEINELKTQAFYTGITKDSFVLLNKISNSNKFIEIQNGKIKDK